MNNRLIEIGKFLHTIYCQAKMFFKRILEKSYSRTAIYPKYELC